MWNRSAGITQIPVRCKCLNPRRPKQVREESRDELKRSTSAQPERHLGRSPIWQSECKADSAQLSDSFETRVARLQTRSDARTPECRRNCSLLKSPGAFDGS